MNARSFACVMRVTAALFIAAPLTSVLAQAQEAPDTQAPSEVARSYFEQQKRVAELEQRQEYMRRQIDAMRAQMELKRTMDEFERIVGSAAPPLSVVAVAQVPQGKVALVRDTAGVQRWVRQGDDLGGWIVAQVQDYAVTVQSKIALERAQQRKGRKPAVQPVTLPFWAASAAASTSGGDSGGMGAQPVGPTLPMVGAVPPPLPPAPSMQGPLPPRMP